MGFKRNRISVVIHDKKESCLKGIRFVKRVAFYFNVFVLKRKEGE